MPVSDSAIVVTGASSGIGAATARLLAEQGAHVVLAARREDVLERIVGEITQRGGSAIACETDVSRMEDMQRLIDRTREHFGRVDALVSNAGITTLGSLSDGRIEEWKAVIDTNLWSVLYGIRAALPVFEAQQAGHFVTVTSTSAIKWVPEQGVYAATKAGARALCEVLRQEVGPTIRSTIICNGVTDTELVKDPARREHFDKIAMSPDAVAHAIAYALAQPPEVNVGEIVVRPAIQP